MVPPQVVRHAPQGLGRAAAGPRVLMGGGAGAAAADGTTAAGALADASTGAITTFADGVGGAAFAQKTGLV